MTAPKSHRSGETPSPAADEGRPRPRVPVAVLIVNYNGRELLEACLDSWAAADPEPESVVVVDNASTDGSVEALGSRYGGVTWLVMEENLGFAAANNRGFEWLRSRSSRPEAVFLCNNDATVHPNVLGPLWRALGDRRNWAAVGPRILNSESGTIWYEGAAIQWWLGRGRHWRHGDAPDRAGAPFELPSRGFVTGCGMLLRWTALEELGGLDETFWAYCEDSDWCLRARAAGWATGVVPEAVMEHVGEASFSRRTALRDYLFARNSLRLIRRHRVGRRPMLWPFTAAMFLGLCAWWAVRRLAARDVAAARALQSAVLDVGTGRPMRLRRFLDSARDPESGLADREPRARRTSSRLERSPTR